MILFLKEEEEEEEEEEEQEEDATDRMRNDLNEVYDNDTNKLAAVQVRLILCLSELNGIEIKQVCLIKLNIWEGKYASIILVFY